MSKLEDLLKKQAEIAAAIEAERSRGREEAVTNVRAAIKQYGITLSEVKSVLVMRKPRSSNGVGKVAKKTGTRRGRPAKK